MSPLEELQADGRLGPEGARLLYRIVRTVVVGHGFPPPGERAAWNGEAVAETAHEFLADGRTPKRLAHLLVHATDDDSFTRILHRMVLNFLRDGGRRTETGRLMLRLRDVLGRSDEFVAEAGERWRLEKQPPTPSSAPPAALVEAAAAERHVDVPRWSAQTRRRAPAADTASLERLCRRVLEAAAGTVALDELAQAVAPRLGLTPMPLAGGGLDRDPFEGMAGPQHADAVLDSLRAAEIFTVLGRRERLLLASAGTPVRELRSVIGVGPSQAAELQAPSGELRPPRQSRPPMPVGVALSKFLDATISPFGRLARTFVEGQALDPRALAVDVSADAVRTVQNSAKSFKTEGKRPGYERIKRHQAEITRLVEEALNQPNVEVASILEEGTPDDPGGEP